MKQYYLAWRHLFIVVSWVVQKANNLSATLQLLKRSIAKTKSVAASYINEKNSHARNYELRVNIASARALINQLSNSIATQLVLAKQCKSQPYLQGRPLRVDS
ncbi:hypothetical protein D3C80_1829420 [compost metagenome]